MEPDVHSSNGKCLVEDKQNPSKLSCDKSISSAKFYDINPQNCHKKLLHFCRVATIEMDKNESISVHSSIVRYIFLHIFPLFLLSLHAPANCIVWYDGASIGSAIHETPFWLGFHSQFKHVKYEAMRMNGRQLQDLDWRQGERP